MLWLVWKQKAIDERQARIVLANPCCRHEPSPISQKRYYFKNAPFAPCGGESFSRVWFVAWRDYPLLTFVSFLLVRASVVGRRHRCPWSGSKDWSTTSCRFTTVWRCVRRLRDANRPRSILVIAIPALLTLCSN